MNTEEPVAGQIYKHFKGNQYMVICVALDSETQEEVVVYREVKVIGGKPWTRKKKEFMEMVNAPGGRRVRRFQQVD